jgi:hypothetical protein
MASNKGVEEVKTMKMRKVKFKVTRHEWWYPVYEVPAHLTDEEALELVQKERPDEVSPRVLWSELAFEKTQ